MPSENSRPATWDDTRHAAIKFAADFPEKSDEEIAKRFNPDNYDVVDGQLMRKFRIPKDASVSMEDTKPIKISDKKFKLNLKGVEKTSGRIENEDYTGPVGYTNPVERDKDTVEPGFVIAQTMKNAVAKAMPKHVKDAWEVGRDLFGKKNEGSSTGTKLLVAGLNQAERSGVGPGKPILPAALGAAGGFFPDLAGGLTQVAHGIDEGQRAIRGVPSRYGEDAMSAFTDEAFDLRQQDILNFGPKIHIAEGVELPLVYMAMDPQTWAGGAGVVKGLARAGKLSGKVAAQMVKDISRGRIDLHIGTLRALGKETLRTALKERPQAGYELLKSGGLQGKDAGHVLDIMRSGFKEIGKSNPDMALRMLEVTKGADRATIIQSLKKYAPDIYQAASRGDWRLPSIAPSVASKTTFQNPLRGSGQKELDAAMKVLDDVDAPPTRPIPGKSGRPDPGTQQKFVKELVEEGGYTLDEAVAIATEDARTVPLTPEEMAISQALREPSPEVLRNPGVEQAWRAEFDRLLSEGGVAPERAAMDLNRFVREFSDETKGIKGTDTGPVEGLQGSVNDAAKRTFWEWFRKDWERGNKAVRDVTGANTPIEVLAYYKQKYPQLENVRLERLPSDAAPPKGMKWQHPNDRAEFRFKYNEKTGDVIEMKILIDDNTSLIAMRHEIEHALDLIHKQDALLQPNKMGRFSHNAFMNEYAQKHGIQPNLISRLHDKVTAALEARKVAKAQKAKIRLGKSRAKDLEARARQNRKDLGNLDAAKVAPRMLEMEQHMTASRIAESLGISFDEAADMVKGQARAGRTVLQIQESLLPLMDDVPLDIASKPKAANMRMRHLRAFIRDGYTTKQAMEKANQITRKWMSKNKAWSAMETPQRPDAPQPPVWMRDIPAARRAWERARDAIAGDRGIGTEQAGRILSEQMKTVDGLQDMWEQLPRDVQSQVSVQMFARDKARFRSHILRGFENTSAELVNNVLRIQAENIADKLMAHGMPRGQAFEIAMETMDGFRAGHRKPFMFADRPPGMTDADVAMLEPEFTRLMSEAYHDFGQAFDDPAKSVRFNVYVDANMSAGLSIEESIMNATVAIVEMENKMGPFRNPNYFGNVKPVDRASWWSRFKAEKVGPAFDRALGGTEVLPADPRPTGNPWRSIKTKLTKVDARGKHYSVSTTPDFKARLTPQKVMKYGKRRRFVNWWRSIPGRSGQWEAQVRGITGRLELAHMDALKAGTKASDNLADLFRTDPHLYHIYNGDFDGFLYDVAEHVLDGRVIERLNTYEPAVRDALKPLMDEWKKQTGTEAGTPEADAIVRARQANAPQSPFKSLDIKPIPDARRFNWTKANSTGLTKSELDKIKAGGKIEGSPRILVEYTLGTGKNARKGNILFHSRVSMDQAMEHIRSLTDKETHITFGEPVEISTYNRAGMRVIQRAEKNGAVRRLYRDLEDSNKSIQMGAVYDHIMDRTHVTAPVKEGSEGALVRERLTTPQSEINPDRYAYATNRPEEAVLLREQGWRQVGPGDPSGIYEHFAANPERLGEASGFLTLEGSDTLPFVTKPTEMGSGPGGALQDLFVRPDIYKDVARMKNSAEAGHIAASKFLNAWKNVTKTWKGWKTVYSPLTHIRNIASNHLFFGAMDPYGATNPLQRARQLPSAAGAGEVLSGRGMSTVPPTPADGIGGGLFKSINDIRNESELYRAAIQRGYVGRTQFTAQELNDLSRVSGETELLEALMSRTSGGKATPRLPGESKPIPGMVDTRSAPWYHLKSQAVRKVARKAKDLYNNEDTIYKLAGLRNRVYSERFHAEYAKATGNKVGPDLLKDSAFMDFAVTDANKYYPNYALVGDAAQTAREVVVGAPFTSFPAEVVRIMINHSKTWEGRANMAAYTALIYGASTMMAEALGLTAEEEEILKEHYGPTFIPLWRDDDGTPVGIDPTGVIPGTETATAFYKLISPTPGEDKIDPLIDLSLRYFGADPILNPGIKATTGRDPQTGWKVTRPGESISDAMARDFPATLAPGFFPNMPIAWAAGKLTGTEPNLNVSARRDLIGPFLYPEMTKSKFTLKTPRTGPHIAAKMFGVPLRDRPMEELNERTEIGLSVKMADIQKRIFAITMDDTLTDEQKAEKEAPLQAEWDKLNEQHTRILERGQKVKYRREGE